MQVAVLIPRMLATRLFVRINEQPNCTLAVRLRELPQTSQGVRQHPRARSQPRSEENKTVTASVRLVAVLSCRHKRDPTAQFCLRYNQTERQPDFGLEIRGSDTKWPTYGFDLFDSSRTIYRDPKKTPRPLELLPKRFLVIEGHDLYPPTTTWRGFQLYPRHCIGQERPIVLLRLDLVSLAYKFDIEQA